MPLSSLPLPDKTPDGKGGEIVWDEAKKKQVKQAILIAVPIMGFLECMLKYYYYSVARRWSTLEPLLKPTY